MADKPTLVIGDVHGNLDRLEALLTQESIIGRCPLCDGHGDENTELGTWCKRCKGDGITRINHDVTVIQLGDLGHFGADGSPTGDLLAYNYGDKWLDTILWGNHDRAVVDRAHSFNGYMKPEPELLHKIKLMHHTGRLCMAVAAHGYLITHAGLHRQWKNEPVPFDKDDPQEVAGYLNVLDRQILAAEDRVFDPRWGVIQNISYQRNGNADSGGVLWRDFNESLYGGFPQVFGHSAAPKHNIRKQPGMDHSYCIDIAGKPDKNTPSNDCLGGIWLPDERLVTWRKNES